MADKTLEMEVKSNVGKVAEDTEKLAKSTKDAQSGIKKLSASFGTLAKATGIVFLLNKAFEVFQEVFRQNQKVVDIFNTAFEVLSIAFNDFFKFLERNIGTATGFMDKIFGNEVVQNVIDFGRTLSIEVITRIKNLVQGIGGLGSALVKLFKKDFAGASETAKAAVKDLTEVVTGNVVETVEMEKAITKVTDKIKDYAKSTIEGAKTLVGLRKESELAAVKVQGLIEEYDRQAEKLRQVRDDETKTFEERIAANEELGRVLKEQEEEMLKLIEIRIREAELDVEKNNSVENQIKLQEALNEKKAVEAQITGFQSEQLVNQVSLQKEQTQVALENAEAQLQAYSDLAGALSGLAGENKALAVAQATIDTYAGATKAFAQGGVAGFVSGAAIIAAGLSNIRKILSVDVPGNTNPPPPPPSETGTPAPEMLSGAFTLTPEQQPVQAYVVTDDMTNNQNKLANIRRRATI
jgi:type IV secretory pathway VirB2 component (pilin)